MSRKIVVPENCTTRQALAIVARTPRVWPGFLAFVARFVCRKAYFYASCWRAGYRVRTVRRIARDHQITAD